MYLLGYLAVGEQFAVSAFGFGGAVGGHEHAHRLGHADGVGHLHQHLVGHAGGHQILGDVAGGVGRRAVHFARVFARERAAAVGALAAVGVYDDFAAREAGIAVRTADDELARGVDVVDNVVGKECLYVVAELGFHARNQDVNDVLLDLRQHGGLVLIELVVLRAHHDGFDGLRRVVVGVADGDLAFGVGAQVGHFAALAAQGSQLAQQAVREVEGQRHVVVGFVRGVAEHHALVASALLLGRGPLYTLVDVHRLRVQLVEHLAGVGIEQVLGLVVANAPDNVAGNGLGIHVRRRFHLACQQHEVGGNQGFAGYFGVGVLAQVFVENGVGNLVGNFIGMAFRNRFGSEQVRH